MKFTLEHKSFDISCLDLIQADRIEENEAVEALGDPRLKREELFDLASINRRAYDLGLLGVSGDLGWDE
jgi:hypothetical protein